MGQQDRIKEAYQQLKNSTEHEYQRIVFEIPNGQGWGDSTGYVVEGNVAGEPIVKVVREDESETIPFGRVIRIHTVQEDD